MRIRILFLTNPCFRQLTVDALNRIKPDCETEVVVYDSFDRIIPMYDLYADSFDAVLVSGTSAKHIIDLTYPDSKKPVVAFQVDSDGLHRDILRMAVHTENLDFRRVAIDFLIPLNTGYSVVDYLNCEDIDTFLSQSHSMAASVYTEGVRTVESVVVEGITTLWEQGAIDMVLCLYSIVAPELEKRGIPFFCPFISDGHLRRLIRDIQTRAELQKLHDNHPAIMQVFPRYPASASADQLSRLDAAVRQYLRENMIECVTQQTQSSSVVITTLQTLRFVTSDFQICGISSYLEEMLDFPVNVGYGVGTSAAHAMNNVQIASKEATLLNQPFVVDSNGNLIGPLSSEKRMIIRAESMPNASQIARQCSLSAMTIQRLISIVQASGSNKITTQELARRMDTTIRNANRIMLNLCKGNVAKPIYTQTSHSRGRPVQVYALDFGI